MSENTQVIAIEEEFTGSLEEIDVDQPSPVVEGDEAVITTLSRLNVRDKEIAKIEQQGYFMKDNIDAWMSNQIHKIEKQKAWLQIPLQSFMEAINKSNPKIKSLKFPVGKIGLRQTPQKIEIDEDFVAETHKEDPFVKAKITYSVSKKDIASQLKETGELPDYASVIPGETKFYYKGGE